MTDQQTPEPVTVHDDWQRDSLVIQFRRRDPLGPGIQYGQPRRLGDDGITQFPGEWLTLPSDGTEAKPHPGLSIRRDDARALLEALSAVLGQPNQVAALVETVETLEAERLSVVAERDEARQDAIVAQMEASQWETLALAKDEHLEALRAHVRALEAHTGREMGTVDLERRRVERAEAPPTLLPAAGDPALLERDTQGRWVPGSED